MKKSSSVSGEMIEWNNEKAKFKKMAQRRQSAPSIVIRNVLGKGIKPPYAGYNREETTVPYSPNVNGQRLSLKFGSTGATLNLSRRKYVMEGKVQLTTGMQTQDRYMFLFTDLLLIAKAKSGSNFKLKYRVRVCELWIASCLDDVSELPKSTDKSFVMGWPVTNCVATFSTPESKELWLGALLEKIHEEKEKESPKQLTLKIIKRDSSNKNQVKMITVTHKETARDVVRLAVKEFGCEDTDNNYNLWVMSRKEGSPYPLIGHENPHAIQLSHIRDVISSNGILQETEITSVARFENVIQPDIKDRCQFILRSNHQSPSGDIAQKRMSRLKAKTPGSIFNWARKRSGQRNESSDSGHVSGNSVGSEGTTFFSSSPPSTSPPATPKLFSLPLGQVCENGELPTPVASMLDILYRKAPYTTGIFRKSANAKTTRQLKRKLDEEEDIDLDDVSIHVIAALFKDFMRNIPNSLLDSELYSKWTDVGELQDDEAKLNCYRSLLSDLDSCNRVLIRRLAIVLNRIASCSGRNNMDASNLAVCISPSLLWPPGPAGQTEDPIKVKEILQYFTERCEEVFDGLVLTDLDWPPQVDFKSDDDDDYEGDNENPNGAVDGSVSPISDIPSSQKSIDHERTIENKENEDDLETNHFNRSRMARRQLQRRKPGSKTDSGRLISLSQDSLDRLIDNTDVLNRVDMSLHSVIHPRRRHRGRDACSMSNDSGFTTLSGEEEEHLPSSLRRATKEPTIVTSASTGSKLNELAEQSMDNVTNDYDDLRTLWSPSLLKISNGQIVEEDELCGVIDEKPDLDDPFAEFPRRKSQPAMPMRQRSEGLQDDYPVSKMKGHHPIYGNSRLVEAITSPVIEYAESDDDDFISFRRKPPKYERLNDRSDYEPTNKQAQEYMRQLREQSTDDVCQNISKLVTPTENKRQYLSGVTVTVNDVRPQEIRQYRPVTLSIHGIGDSPAFPDSNSPEHLDSSSATYTDNHFFSGGEELSSGSTPDPDVLSSHEDVFKNWDCRPSGQDSRTRSKTTSEIDQTPMTAPLSRRFNSARSPRKIQLDLNVSPAGSPTECMSPIQKLTENLQMIPDFRQHATPKIARRSVPDDNSAFFGRKKASSVREGRNYTKSTIPSHYVRLKRPSEPSTTSDASCKTNLELESSQSSISNASKSSIESSSRTSLNDASSTSPVVEKSFERDIRTRRPYSRRRYNLASKMGSKDVGVGTFSKSLPTNDWKSVKSDSLSKRESSRESVQSDIPNGENCSNDVTNDVTNRLRQASNKLKEADILHMAGAVQSRIRELSSSPSDELRDNATSSQEFRPRAGSVKSKVTAFNHLITNASAASPSSSPSECIIRDNNEEFHVKRKAAIATPFERPSPVRSHLTTHRKAVTDSGSKKSEDSSRNGLVIRTTPDPDLQKSIHHRIKEPISVQIHLPDAKPRIDKVTHRKSPQPVSDDLIFNLSESFAFGNRKSPRHIIADESPRDSPVSVRRRRVDAQTKRLSNPSPTNHSHTERRRHLSVDRYSPTKQRNNVHVTSWQVKHKADNGELTPTKRSLNSLQKPPPFSAQIPPRDKNSNELPFIGFEKVFDSEESYV